MPKTTRAFILGAYPSALHIRWEPPHGQGRPVNALAIDNEPRCFWNGAGEEELLEGWRATVGWEPHWGESRPAHRFNGSSGQRVDEEILFPLDISRDEAWLTDCLDTYHASIRVAKAISEVYELFARQAGLPSSSLPVHPDTRAIIGRADLVRLRAELSEAEPEMVISLGEAAFSVMRQLLDRVDPQKLPAEAAYGNKIPVQVGKRKVVWYPLVHPGQRNAPWRGWHQEWMESRG